MSRREPLCGWNGGTIGLHPCQIGRCIGTSDCPRAVKVIVPPVAARGVGERAKKCAVHDSVSLLPRINKRSGRAEWTAVNNNFCPECGARSH